MRKNCCVDDRAVVVPFTYTGSTAVFPSLRVTPNRSSVCSSRGELARRADDTFVATFILTAGGVACAGKRVDPETAACWQLPAAGAQAPLSEPPAGHERAAPKPVATPALATAAPLSPSASTRRASRGGPSTVAPAGDPAPGPAARGQRPTLPHTSAVGFFTLTGIPPPGGQARPSHACAGDGAAPPRGGSIMPVGVAGARPDASVGAHTAVGSRRAAERPTSTSFARRVGRRGTPRSALGGARGARGGARRGRGGAATCAPRRGGRRGKGLSPPAELIAAAAAAARRGSTTRVRTYVA